MVYAFNNKLQRLALWPEPLPGDPDPWREYGFVASVLLIAARLVSFLGMPQVRASSDTESFPFCPFLLSKVIKQALYKSSLSGPVQPVRPAAVQRVPTGRAAARLAAAGAAHLRARGHAGQVQGAPQGDRPQELSHARQGRRRELRLPGEEYVSKSANFCLAFFKEGARQQT